MPQLNKFGEPKVVLRPKPAVQAELDENQDLQCEWWDAFFLRPEENAAKRFDSTIVEDQIYHERITHFIQHPLPLKNE